MNVSITKCCTNCGARLDEDALFCSACGYPVDLWNESASKGKSAPAHKKHWAKKVSVTGWKGTVITITAIVLLLAMATTLVSNYFAVLGGPFQQMTAAINHTIRAESFTLDTASEYGVFDRASYSSIYACYNLKEENLLLWMTEAADSDDNDTIAICDGYGARKWSDGTYSSENMQKSINNLFEAYRQTSNLHFKRTDWQSLLDSMERGLYRTIARKIDMEQAEKDLQKLIKHMNGKKWMKENAGYSCKWKNGVMTHTLRIDLYTFLMACLECFEDSFYSKSDYYALQDEIEETFWNEDRLDISLSVKKGKVSAFTCTDGYTNITGTFRGVGSTVIDEQDVRAFVDKARRS